MKINQLMLRVGDWFRTHCLSLALAKTEVVILIKKRMDTVILVSVGNEVIQATRVGKYLGVSIDSKMNFFAQIYKMAYKLNRCSFTAPNFGLIPWTRSVIG